RGLPARQIGTSNRDEEIVTRKALPVLAAKDPTLGVLAVAGANDAQRVPLESLRGALFGVDHGQPHGVAQLRGAGGCRPDPQRHRQPTNEAASESLRPCCGRHGTSVYHRLMTRSIVVTLSLFALSMGACARTVMDQPVNRVGDGWTLIVRKVTDGPNSFDEGNVIIKPKKGDR